MTNDPLSPLPSIESPPLPPPVVPNPDEREREGQKVANRLTLALIVVIVAICVAFGAMATAIVLLSGRQDLSSARTVDNATIITAVRQQVNENETSNRKFQCANVAAEIRVYQSELTLPGLPPDVINALQESIAANEALALAENCPRASPQPRP